MIVGEKCFAESFRFGRLGLVGLAQEVRQRDGRQNADDHDHDHQLHQGEALFHQVAALFEAKHCQLQFGVRAGHGCESVNSLPPHFSQNSFQELKIGLKLV